ncbi:hypothetical protein FHS55_003386 [Angulomicrobium tetraedrale]|uniref:Uncharacterized protein n=1 Tax=Ancylobacter tetraedralis TaxID=217068 RepID=A0A839ZDN6_9HYPH|nr:hypothetical protein [Ancylobacter tetraedralis]MBB3772765.1 hypothetical protein [Ancylobacter tetraedralis]
MRHSRPFRPKKIFRVASDAPSPASSLAGAPLSKIPHCDARVIRDAEQNLGPADSVEHDSKVVHVTDDWPSSVPITPDEVDVVEAFLRREIDALLR